MESTRIVRRVKLEEFLSTISEKLWTAPELLRDDVASLNGTKPGDVYAFAIIMHEVIYQTKPYGPEVIPVEVILDRVSAGECPPFRPKVSELVYKLFEFQITRN